MRNVNTLFATLRSRRICPTSLYVMQIVAAALISTFSLLAVAAGQTTKTGENAEAEALDNWRAAIAQTPTPSEGCFEASFPYMVWEQTECHTVPLRVYPNPKHPKRTSAETGNTVGNGNDYVAQSVGG
jgi:hypothetical protein